MGTHTLIVLDDGETYSLAHNAKLVIVNDFTMRQIEKGEVKAGQCWPIVEIELDVFVPRV